MDRPERGHWCTSTGLKLLTVGNRRPKINKQKIQLGYNNTETDRKLMIESCAIQLTSRNSNTFFYK